MLRTEIAKGQGGRILLMDSITKLTPDDAGALIVAASHGGASAGECAAQVPVKLVIFNDAGVGKDRAGVAALDMLQQCGMAAATVAHTSARIGDAMDMWEHGQVSHVNVAAQAQGLAIGQNLKATLLAAIAKHEGLS